MEWSRAGWRTNGLPGKMDCNIEPDSGKVEVKQWKK